MKIINFILIVLVFFSCFSCAFKDGEDGQDGQDGGTGQELTVTNPSGKAESGPCYLLSSVSAMSMDANWLQSGYVLGEMSENDGSYQVPGAFSGAYIVYDFDGTCYSEGDNIDVGDVRMKMGQGSSATSHNINHATTWRYHLARRYFTDPSHPNYQDASGSFMQAKTDIYAFLNFTGATKNFYELSITGDTTGDAYLLGFEAAVTKGRDGPGQSHYIGQAVNAVIDGDLTFRQNLKDAIADLPIYSIYNNLKDKLTSLGFSVDPAPIYNLPLYPSYYADIMGGGKTVQGSTNLGDETTCNFDQSTYNLFAVPFMFDSSIGTSRYQALNFPNDAQVSIWDVGIDGSGNPAPGTKLLDLTTLNEILLNDPVVLSYNGDLGSSHGLVEGVWYYYRIRKDDDFILSKSCDGTRLDTNYSLASDDEGATWIGHNNNADPFFYFTGIREYRTN